MGLNKSKGQMYSFITHTWNAIKGHCYHQCAYCYMMKWGNLKAVRLDAPEFKTDLGNNNFIFVGSSCDMFADNIPDEWIIKTLQYCNSFNNKYLFQTKNPKRVIDFIKSGHIFNENTVICTTIESNRFYKSIMNSSPSITSRVSAMKEIAELGYMTYVTIEPILDFDVEELLSYIKDCSPNQVNIGADSGGHKLPEPDKKKVLELIKGLKQFTTVHNKKNLKRLIK